MLIENLSKQSGVSESKISRIEGTASKRYKVYKIPKKTGGHRVIEHPSRELKAVQRWINKTVIEKFPVHINATAYKKGSGIRSNAERHVNTNYTTRIDFKNFFPSFKQERILLFVDKMNTQLNLNLSNRDLQFIGNVVCRNGKLTIGAPSSPLLSNSMMYEFDTLFSNICDERSLVYTRYADDLFISSRKPHSLGGLEDEIRRINRSVDHLALRINHQKTAYLSRKYGRRIAGVVITPDRKLSIGRERKREIKSLIHKWSIGALPKDRLDYVRGLLAYSCDVEQSFEVRLRAKYSNETIDRLLHEPLY